MTQTRVSTGYESYAEDQLQALYDQHAAHTHDLFMAIHFGPELEPAVKDMLQRSYTDAMLVRSRIMDEMITRQAMARQFSRTVVLADSDDAGYVDEMSLGGEPYDPHAMASQSSGGKKV